MISWKRIAFTLVMSLAVVALMLGASGCGGKKADPAAESANADEAREVLRQQIEANQQQGGQAQSAPDIPQNESKRERRDRERNER